MIFRTFDMLHKHKIIHQNAQITRANIPSTLVYINAVIEKYNKLYSLCMQLFCVFFSLSLSLSFSLYRGWNRNGVCISICTNIIFYLQINCEALGSSRKTIHNTMLDDEDEKKKTLCNRNRENSDWYCNYYMRLPMFILQNHPLFIRCDDSLQ